MKTEFRLVSSPSIPSFLYSARILWGVVGEAAGVRRRQNSLHPHLLCCHLASIRGSVVTERDWPQAPGGHNRMLPPELDFFVNSALLSSGA